MKIGIDARCFLEKKYSGVSFYTSNLLSSWAEISPHDKFILHVNSFFKPQHWPNLKSSNIFKLITNYPSKLISLSTFLFDRPYFDKWLDSSDAYWVPGNNFISLSNQVKKVYTCHDLSWLVFPEFYSLKGKIWHKALQLTKKFLQADKIIAVSEYTKSDLLRFYPQIDEKKVVVIHSGVNLKKITEEQVDYYAKNLSLPEDYILYLGNIEPRKNVLNLILAFNKIYKDFPGLNLIIAGGSGWHYGYSRLVLNVSKKNPQIRYLGYVNEEQKSVLYKKAKIFVFPSYYEGFGFPPLEAMQCACPVITSQTTSLPEIVGRAAVLINPFDINDIASAIAEVLKNTSWQTELIKRGQEQVQNFTWQKTALQMKELFSQL